MERRRLGIARPKAASIDGLVLSVRDLHDKQDATVGELRRIAGILEERLPARSEP